VSPRLAGLVLMEAWAVVRAQRAPSIVTLLIVAAMCSTVLLTTGRATAMEYQVLDSIRSPGARSIVVRANPGSGLDTSVVQRIRRLGGVSWIGAFGDSVDVSNTALAGGKRVSERALVASSLGQIGISPVAAPTKLGHITFASQTAARELGLADGVGGVVSSDQEHFAVIRTIALPSYLRFLEPIVIMPASVSAGNAAEVSALVVVVRQPGLIAPMASAIRGLLGVSDLSQISVSTSEAVARIHQVVQSKLGAFNTSLVIIVVASTATLVSIVLFGLVLLKRRDFGRRRALGATRSLIVGLLLVQTFELALVGGALGSCLGLSMLAVTGSPFPPAAFVVATATLATIACLVGALLPAAVASRREPLKELRVP